jgi:hypothetical protein
MEVHPEVLGKSRCLSLGRSRPIRSEKRSDEADYGSMPDDMESSAVASTPDPPTLIDMEALPTNSNVQRHWFT